MSKLDELIEKLCPNGVEFEKLGELIAQNPKSKIGAKKAENFEKGNYPFYTSGKIIYYTTEFFVDGENIFVNDGGQADIKYYDGKSAYADHVISFKPLENVNGRYIYHYLMKRRDYINEKMFRGSGIKNIQKKEFFEMRIPVPPLEVQCEIVRILDNFTLLSAELSAELSARKKQYEYYIEKIWDNLQNEEIIKLSNICKIGDGLHGTPEYRNETELWFINGNNLDNGKITINNATKEISKNSYDKYNGNFKIGTILMSINGTIGKIAYYNGEKIILGKSVAYFEIIDENVVNNKYLYYYLQSKEALRYFENNKTGSTIKNLGLKALREMNIPFPSLEKQKLISNQIEKFDDLCNNITEGLPAEIEARQKQYEYYRDKLLSFKELKNS